MFLLLLIIHIERPKFSRKHFRSLETSDCREMGEGGEDRRGEERRGEEWRGEERRREERRGEERRGERERERERETLKDRFAVSFDEPNSACEVSPITIGVSILFCFFSVSLCRTSVSIIRSAIQECDFYRFWHHHRYIKNA